MTTLKGNLKLAENIEKKQNPNRGGGGGASKAVMGNKCESKKENDTHLTLWQSECIALKKVSPTPGDPLTKTFMKKERPGVWH